MPTAGADRGRVEAGPAEGEADRPGERESALLPAVPRSDWLAMPATGRGAQHLPTRVTVHHTGDAWRGEPEAAEYLRRLQRFHQEDRGWHDIAYHLLIDREGRVYEGRDLLEVGDTATDYDPRGHLAVCLLGNYDVLEPTPEQLAALKSVIRWAAQRFDIPAQELGAHRDFAPTRCPGDRLARALAGIRDAAAAEQR